MIRTAARQFLCAFVLSAVAYGDAATTFYGTTAQHPFFFRANEGGGVSGVSVRYEAQDFIVNASTTCVITSTQEGGYDGMIFLYEFGFNPANSAANLLAADDDGPDFGVGTSRINPVSLVAGRHYVLVTTGYFSGTSGTFSNQVSCSDPTTRVLVGYGIFGSNLPEDYDGRRAQLLGGRFEVSVVGFDFVGTPFVGRTAPLASNDSAVFYFFQPANFELLVKVVNGCGLNSRYWVYYAATTNVDFTLTVTDTFVAPPFNTRTYHNTIGTQQATSVADTNAFGNCI